MVGEKHGKHELNVVGNKLVTTFNLMMMDPVWWVVVSVVLNLVIVVLSHHFSSLVGME